jgi:hypothetical protein
LCYQRYQTSNPNTEKSAVALKHIHSTVLSCTNPLLRICKLSALDFKVAWS